MGLASSIEHEQSNKFKDQKNSFDIIIKQSNYKGRNIVGVFEQIYDIIPEEFPDKYKMGQEAYNLFYKTLYKAPETWHESWYDLSKILAHYLDDVNESWVDNASLIMNQS